jgi:tetratricopeptide (TPR) repeat protein
MKNCFNKSCFIKSALTVSVLAILIMLIVIVREEQHPWRPYLQKWPVLSLLIKERNNTQTTVKLIDLRSKQPVLDNLIKFIFEADRSKPESLNEYLAYYRLINEYFPELSDAYGMLGYCYFYLGELEKSREAFLKARELNKQYFWFSYDLGMVNLKLNKLDEAKMSLNEAYALGTSGVEQSLLFLQQAQTFQQIFGRVSGISTEYFRNNLIAGYQMIDHLQQNGWKKPADIQLKLF